MAEGLLRSMSDEVEVFSAGNEPTTVHPFAIRMMEEIGIDISRQKSKSIDRFQGEEFDYVITLCGDTAKDKCPAFIGSAKHRLHWNFRDPVEVQEPEEAVVDIFREVRDEIRDKIAGLLEEQ
jgi:arsenate reductase